MTLTRRLVNSHSLHSQDSCQSSTCLPRQRHQNAFQGSKNQHSSVSKKTISRISFCFPNEVWCILYLAAITVISNDIGFTLAKPRSVVTNCRDSATVTACTPCTVLGNNCIAIVTSQTAVTVITCSSIGALETLSC